MSTQFRDLQEASDDNEGDRFLFYDSPIIYVKIGKNEYIPLRPINQEDKNFRTMVNLNQPVEPA